MKLSRLFSPPPFQARHYKRTFVSSPDDEASRPSRAVIDTALDCVRKTLEVEVDDVCARLPPVAWSPGMWPGEHYRLLAGVVARLQPRTVVEIGTETGLSALCLRKYLPADGTITTFDLLPWRDFDNTCLEEGDFEDGRLVQELADLADPDVFQTYAPLLSKADLVFADGPKDGSFEPALIRNLDTLEFQNPPFVLFDDIRDHHMLKVWRELNHPKLDLTSFGHWTGTGLAHWTPARD